MFRGLKVFRLMFHGIVKVRKCGGLGAKDWRELLLHK